MNKNKVTIVMYHYVRPLQGSRYPTLKGLDLPLFISQLDFLQKNYHFITMEQLIDAIENDSQLPPKSILLTFDDAYIDHFTNVFPILLARKIQGSFYAPAKAISEGTVLDVNKIHFILASTQNANDLIARTFRELDKYRHEHQLESNEFYFDKLAVANRFDTKEIIFVKRLLQKELPEKVRDKILNVLFEEYVGLSEKAFSTELYMNRDQLRVMLQNGMHIGNHGYEHYWLNSLPEDRQRVEVQKGCDFLNSIGVDMSRWTMCYPYGAYNQSLINILQETNCKLSLTTAVDVADLSSHNRFELPRLDTNDLPKTAHSEINDWFLKA